MEKILIISDLHLTTNFIRKKFLFLKDLISKYDRIIINGDFWSGYYNTFEEFTKTPWKDLFPILKSKKTIYLFGNHDRKSWLNDNVNLFSVWNGDEYRLEVGSKKFLITHGHQFLGDSITSEGYMAFWRKYKIDAIKYFVESLFLRIFGRYFYIVAIPANNKVKNLSKKLEGVDYLVIGHTHWGEIDNKTKFMNTGLIHSGVATFIEIVDNSPKFVSTRY